MYKSYPNCEIKFNFKTRSKKSTEQEEKLKKLKDDIARQQEQLNKLAEKVREVE